MAPLLLCLCLSLSPSRDRWIGEDKWKHFFASFAATTAGASAARLSGLPPGASLWVGVGTGAGFGVWKEVRDHRAPGGSASLRDVAWDAAGIGAATVLLDRAR